MEYNDLTTDVKLKIKTFICDILNVTRARLFSHARQNSAHVDFFLKSTLNRLSPDGLKSAQFSFVGLWDSSVRAKVRANVFY